MLRRSLSPANQLCRPRQTERYHCWALFQRPANTSLYPSQTNRYCCLLRAFAQDDTYKSTVQLSDTMSTVESLTAEAYDALPACRTTGALCRIERCVGRARVGPGNNYLVQSPTPCSAHCIE